MSLRLRQHLFEQSPSLVTLAMILAQMTSPPSFERERDVPNAVSAPARQRVNVGDSTRAVRGCHGEGERVHIVILIHYNCRIGCRQ